MLYNDFNNIDEYSDEVDQMDDEQEAKCIGGGGCECGHPPYICKIMGIKIMKSAIEFENSLSAYLRCQCRIIKRLIRDGQYDIIDDVLKQMGDNLHQIYNIESQIIGKLEKGAYLSNCLEPEG